MNKDRLFQFLGEQDSSVLLGLLSNAYDYLSHDDRKYIFGDYVKKLPSSEVDGAALLAEIEQSCHRLSDNAGSYSHAGSVC